MNNTTTQNVHRSSANTITQITPPRASTAPLSSRRVLNETFGCKRFRQHQEGIIDAILQGYDVVAVMPTGAGKSLCYQLPAVCLPGTCVVISPLISLMKDQVDKLGRLGVRAAYLNSALKPKQQQTVMQRFRQQAYDILYVAPERFVMDGFREALDVTEIALFAIDEAHCISEWGHDFRPDYLALSDLTQRYRDVPVAAFTATATQRDQDAIVSRLRLRSPHRVRASFDRENLFYDVVPKVDDLDQILAFVKRQKGASGIIYRGTRRGVEETAEFLEMNGVKALPYHAGLDNTVRRNHQDAFDAGKCPVIVATIAFGMGIDKPDVRFVVHGDLPKSMDSYYQETGRAGRDGKPAHCLLLFSKKDVPRAQFFINKIQNAQEKRNAFDRLDAIIRFGNSRFCRRRVLLGYFGEQYGHRRCGGCDACHPKASFQARMQYRAEGSGNRRPLRTAALLPTLKLLKEGLSYVQIASHRGLKPTTIAGHIDELATRGERFDLDVHVPASKRKIIERLFATHGMDRLKPPVEASGGNVSYDEARLVRAALRSRSSSSF